MAEETLIPQKRSRRKTIGEEGSRRQTIVAFFSFLTLGLIIYLPGRINRPQIKLNLPGWGSEVITIKKSGREPSARPEPPLLAELVSGQAGSYGIYIQTVDGNKELKLNDDQIMTAASVIKLPVLTVYYQAVDQGKLDPEEIYSLKEADRWVYGTGSMQYRPAGKEYSYREIAGLVANQSDNMGMEVLIKKLGGYAKTQTLINGLGLVKTNLKENEITTAEAGGLFLQLAQGKWLSPVSRKELFDNLTKTVNEDRLPAGVPDHVRVVHKFGSETGVVNDCGLVEADNPYVLCILTTGVNAGEAEKILPQISAAVWQWLGD